MCPFIASAHIIIFKPHEFALCFISKSTVSPDRTKTPVSRNEVIMPFDRRDFQPILNYEIPPEEIHPVPSRDTASRNVTKIPKVPSLLVAIVETADAAQIAVPSAFLPFMVGNHS